MRWQTIQLLLEPGDHVPLLQEAVKRFDLTNPVDGRSFPNVLPKESLPCQPDMEMLEWHKNIAERLRLEMTASTTSKGNVSECQNMLPGLSELATST